MSELILLYISVTKINTDMACISGEKPKDCWISPASLPDVSKPLQAYDFFFPGKLPSWTTFQSSLWLQPRENTPIPELLLCIFSCFGNSFKQLRYRHSQNNSLFWLSGMCVPKSEFCDQSPRLDSPPILVTHSNKFTKKKQCRRFHIWFLTVNKRRDWSLLNIPCHLLYHVKD